MCSDIAMTQIQEAYTDCKCIAIPGYDNIVKEGGAINCTTWNIQTDIDISNKYENPR